MTKEKIAKILELLHNYPDYRDDKRVFYFHFNECKENPDKLESLFDVLAKYINEKNLPRRKVFGLLYEIQEDFDANSEHPEYLDNFISNMLESLVDGKGWLYIKNGKPSNAEIKEFSITKMQWDWIEREYWQNGKW